MFIVGKKFCSYESLYTYPFNSEKLKIFVCDKLCDNLECWRLLHIDSKCFVFPLRNKHDHFQFYTHYTNNNFVYNIFEIVCVCVILRVSY